MVCEFSRIFALRKLNSSYFFLNKIYEKHCREIQKRTAIRMPQNMSMKNVIPIFGVLFLSLVSCENEPNNDGPTFDENQIVGRWELVEAFRNGKKTEMLTDAFYEFEKDGNLSTNFPPSVNELSLTYAFDGQKVETKGAEELVFEVENLTDSTLTLSMVVQKFPFKLILERAVESEANESGEEGILQ